MKFPRAFLLPLIYLFSFSLQADYYNDFKDQLQDCKPQGRRHDYRSNDPDARKLKSMVEGAHFTEGVRKGLYGNAGSLESDLNYVLQKYPNHPLALMIMAKHWSGPDFVQLQRADRKDYKWGTKECFFLHALQFAEDDPSVHLVIAIFYHQQKNYKVAGRHYLNAIKYGPNNSEAHYNLGIFYMDTNDYEKALEQAKIAMKLGYPLSGLKDRLVRENVWKME